MKAVFYILLRIEKIVALVIEKDSSTNLKK
jgi:hypothetical protein